jgi:hypothetical protein
MDKIVVIAGDSGTDESLIESLKMLFPECEIQIVSREGFGLGDTPIAPGSVTIEREEEKH